MNGYDNLAEVDALSLGRMVDDQFDEVIRARELIKYCDSPEVRAHYGLVCEVLSHTGAEMLIRELAVMDLAEYDVVREAERACYVGDFSGIIEANGLNEDAR